MIEPEDPSSRVRNRLAGGWETAERRLVRPRPVPANGHAVSLCNHFVDRVVDVREGGAQTHDDPAETGGALVALRTDVIGRHQRIERGEVVAVESLEQLLGISLVV